MSGYQIGYIVGSLSAQSINRTLAEALIRLAPEYLEFVEIPILDLPLYNRDLDADYPLAARMLKDAIAAADAAFRYAGVQPRRAGRPEERHRLGQPPAWNKLVRA
jgi:hypothetical protein